MATILLSIRPEWAAKIYSGKKHLELRKTLPRCESPWRVLFLESGTKKITGEAYVTGCTPIKPVYYSEKVRAHLLSRLQMTEAEIQAYCKGAMAWGWCMQSDLDPQDHPVLKYREAVPFYGVSPQSWRYVDEAEERLIFGDREPLEVEPIYPINEDGTPLKPARLLFVETTETLGFSGEEASDE